VEIDLCVVYDINLFLYPIATSVFSHPFFISFIAVIVIAYPECFT